MMEKSGEIRWSNNGRQQRQTKNLSQDSLASPPARLSSLNGNSINLASSLLRGGTAENRNNPNFISDENDQQQQHSHVHFSDRRINPRRNGSPTPARVRFSSSSSSEIYSPFPSCSSAPLSTQRLDSFLDDYEEKYGIEPLENEVQDLTKETLLKLLKNPQCLTKLEEILAKDSSRRITPSSSLSLSSSSNLPSCSPRGEDADSDQSTRFCINGKGISNGHINGRQALPTIKDPVDREESSLFRANSNNNRSNSPKTIVNFNDCKEEQPTTSESSAAHPPCCSKNFQMPPVTAAKIPTFSNNEKHHEVNAANTKNSNTTSAGGVSDRINTEVAKASTIDNQRTLGNVGGGKGMPAFTTPQQPPQHIDNSKDDTVGACDAKELKGIRKKSSSISNAPETSFPPPPTTPPASASAVVSSAGSEITVASSGTIFMLPNQDRGSKSKIPVPLPKTKSKSVKEVVTKAKISPCTFSSAKSSGILGNNNNPPNQQIPNSAQQVGHGKDEEKAEVKAKDELVIDQRKRNKEEEEKDDETNLKLANPPPPVKKNIGEGDEVSNALELIDGLSGHTTWVMRKLLEYPVSNEEAKERVRQLRVCPDVGDFFGAPYMTREIRDHVFFGSGKLPKSG